MDHAQILAAANFAAERHAFQRRKGDPAEPYINHLLEVAYLLAEFCDDFDPVLIMGGLLHDTIEDAGVTRGVGGTVRRRGGVAGRRGHRRQVAAQARPQIAAGGTCARKSARAQNLSTADKISNVRSTLSNPPSDWTPERRREYVEWAHSIVKQFTEVAPRLRAEFERTWDRFVDSQAALC